MSTVVETPSLINIDAEAALLGALMQDNSNIDFAADLIDAECFVEPLHSEIFNAIIREFSRGKMATPVTIQGYFEGNETMAALGGTSYLMRLTAETGLSSPRALCDILIDLKLRRRMRAGLMTAADACRDLDQTVGEIVSFADSALTVDGKEQIHQPTAGEAFVELMESFKHEGRGGVTCGRIGVLDDLLGAIRPKELIILAARPGMGKTACALSYTIGAAKQGHGVLFVSLEMGSTELAGRMAADLCYRDGVPGVPYGAISKGKLDEWQMKQVAGATSYVSGLPINVVDTGSVTMGRLAMLVRRHKRRMEARGHKLELVVIDYLQLAQPDQRARSNYEAVSEVSRLLKALAKNEGVGILALAQLSREVEKRPDKRPQLADLRDSGQIEQDADGVLFLLREEYYLAQTEPDEFSPKHPEWVENMERAKGNIEFIVAKRRNGTTGKAVGAFHGAFQAVRG